MMAPRIAGLICCHSPSALVTVMKSLPRKTPVTPGSANRRSASGDLAAPDASECRGRRRPILAVPQEFQGRRIGVASVWMNIRLLLCRDGFKARGPRAHHTHSRWDLAKSVNVAGAKEFRGRCVRQSGVASRVIARGGSKRCPLPPQFRKPRPVPLRGTMTAPPPAWSMPIRGRHGLAAGRLGLRDGPPARWCGRTSCLSNGCRSGGSGRSTPRACCSAGCPSPHRHRLSRRLPHGAPRAVLPGARPCRPVASQPRPRRRAGDAHHRDDPRAGRIPRVADAGRGGVRAGSLLNGFNILVTLVRRHTEELYIADWFILGAFTWLRSSM